MQLRLINGTGRTQMLRITSLDELDRVTLKLEGRLAGVWVAELEGIWRNLNSQLVGRPLYLNMTGVECVDRAGTYLLALLRQHGAQLITSGTLMTELVRSIEEDWLVIEHQ
jgi:ABC-type transporter Mla MlaB component